MLLEIRENMQSWVAWLIVGLISIPFALFGINSYLGGADTVVVAKVNDTEIELRAYQNALDQYKRRLRTALGKDYTADMADNPIAKRAVLDSLVAQALTTQYISDAGYEISDSQLLAAIMAVPEFEKNGKFDQETYSRVVNTQGITKEQFEITMRQDLRLQQFRDNLSQTGFVTKATLDEIGALQNQVRTARKLVVKSDDVKVDTEITKAAIQAHYEKTKARYEIPEAVKVRYARLSVAELAKKIKVDDAQVAALYAQQKVQRKTDELRDFSHIMLLVSNAESDEEVLKRITKIKTSLDAGENFSDSAKAHSEDVGSALNGGAMGYNSRTTLEKSLADSTFSMAVGEVSQPVRTKFGYHIVKLNNIKAAKAKTLTVLKSTLVKEEQQRQAHEQFFDQVEQFSNLAYETPDSLAPLEDTLKLGLQESDWISKTGGAGVFANQNVLRELFSDEVLQDGQNTAVVEITDEDYVVLRVLEHRKQSYQKLAEVKAKVKEDLAEQRIKTALQSKGDAMVSALEKGESLEVTKDLWSKATDYTVDSDLSNISKQLLFSMPAPKEGMMRYQGTKENKSFVIFALEKVADGKAVSKEQRTQLQLGLLQATGTRSAENFMASLRSEAEVEVFYDQVLDE